MKRLLLVLALLATAFFTSTRAEEIVVLNDAAQLVRFETSSPGLSTTVAVTGLQPSETLVGMDFRPGTGQLFAVGSTSRVYVLNLATGVATQVGTTTFTPALSGTHFAINFNPTVDRIHLVSETAQNLRLNPATGAITGTDTTLAYAPLDAGTGQTPRITAVSYTNNFSVATSTTLYGIDSARGTLVTIGSLNSTVSPNGGRVFTVGRLGRNTTDLATLDISGQTGIAYATLQPSGAAPSQLFTINLSTGTAIPVAGVAPLGNVVALAVMPAPTVFDTVVLRTDNTLVRLNSAFPGLTTVAATITGLSVGETMQEIAYRPASGVLYGVGSTGQVYTLDPVTAVATATPNGLLSPVPSSFNAGFSFNPVADRIRLINDNDQNFRIDPVTGLTAANDPAVAYAAGDPNAGNSPTVVAVAYSNFFAGASSTTLFGIDSNFDTLVTINPDPALSNLIHLASTVGALGVDVGLVTGFAITPSGTALLATSTSLYSVNLATGAATQLTTTAGSVNIRSLAPVAQTAAGTVQFASANVTVTEGSLASIVVTRTSPANGAATVDYTVAPDTAVAGTNLLPVAGTLTFANGETSRTIFVQTLDDAELNLFLTADVTLSNPIGTTLGAQSTGTLTIADVNDNDGDGFPNDVEAVAGTLQNDAASTPFNNQPAGTAIPLLSVKKASFSLNFATAGKDSLSFSGTFSPGLAPVPPGTRFIVQLGSAAGKAGFVQLYIFDSRGRAPKGLTLSKPSKTGVQTFSITVSKAMLGGALNGAGFTNVTATKKPLPFDAAVYFNNVVSTAKPNVSYTVKLNKSGLGTLIK